MYLEEIGIAATKITGESVWDTQTMTEAKCQIKLTFDEAQSFSNYANDPRVSSKERILDLAGRVLDYCENGPGFCIVRGFDPNETNASGQHELFAAICSAIGKTVPQNRQGDHICEVTDVNRGRMEDSSVRGYLTNQSLSLHTDSSDILALYCKAAAKSGGGSLVASVGSIYNEILQNYSELLPTFYTGLLYDHREQDRTNPYPAYRNPIFHWDGELLSCRYYLPNYIQPAYDKMGIQMSAAERKCIEVFEEIVSMPKLSYEFVLNPGDFAFYSNHSVLHGRSSYLDDEDPSKSPRKLLRAWINPTNPRELPDSFARFRFGYPLDTNGK